jgi:hypothetical protein
VDSKIVKSGRQAGGEGDGGGGDGRAGNPGHLGSRSSKT